jgi:glutaredoxin 3
MKKAIFYHAGCSVCLDAEKKILDLVDMQKYKLEVVHFGSQKDRIAEAKKAGVKSVPALVIDNEVLHLNFGASMDDVARS